jgi:hypothetical protein
MGRCALSFRHWYGRDVLDRGRDVVSHWLPVVSAIAWEGVTAGQCRAKARLGAPDRGKYREAAGAIVGKSRFLQVVKASLTLRVAKARLMLQAAKPSLTLGAAKLQAAKLRSSRHRRPQRPRRNRAALRSVRDNNTSIRPHPTTSRHDRPASHDASDHPSTRVGHDRRGQRMFVCAVGAPPARVWFAPLARVWFPPLGFSPRSRRAPLLGQTRKMTVQLASTPVQRLSDRLALSSAFANVPCYETVT